MANSNLLSEYNPPSLITILHATGAPAFNDDALIATHQLLSPALNRATFFNGGRWIWGDEEEDEVSLKMKHQSTESKKKKKDRRRRRRRINSVLCSTPIFDSAALLPAALLVFIRVWDQKKRFEKPILAQLSDRNQKESMSKSLSYTTKDAHYDNAKFR